MRIRLNKYLAQHGIAARRKVDEIIAQKRVQINGNTAQLGAVIDPDKDIVLVDGKKIGKGNKLTYYIVNKPEEILSTVTDDHGRDAVIELVPGNPAVFPVGRLDYMSTGLILLTNDGDFAYKMTHPKYHVPKTYFVKVKETVSQKSLDIIRRGGIQIEDRETSPTDIKKLGAHTFEITLYEGIKRQVRKSCEYVGLTVTELKRIKFGDIELGKLAEGKYRTPTAKELNYINKIKQQPLVFTKRKS